MNEIARAIMAERPPFVIVSDAHVDSVPQNVAASLVEALSRSPTFQPGDIGFYIGLVP
jgi:hypothetical protein